jgi:hypothetical protein
MTMTDTVDFDNSVDPVMDEQFPNITAYESDTESADHEEDDEPQQADAPEPAEN